MSGNKGNILIIVLFWLFIFVVIALLCGGCSWSPFGRPVTEQGLTYSEKVEKLQILYNLNKDTYLSIVDPVTLWPSIHDCDGVLYAGYACMAEVGITTQYFETKPGLVGRRPNIQSQCWDGKDLGSKAFTSNDMQQGAFACGWRTQDLEFLKRIAKYGETHGWMFGGAESDAIDRVYLKPSGRGVLGSAIYALSHGGIAKSYRIWPNVYVSVDEDYRKRLQVMDIILRGEIDEMISKNELDPIPSSDDPALELLGITQSMLDRLEALTIEDPKDYFFATAYAVYTGNYGIAMDLLLDSSTPTPSYVRCTDNQEACRLSHWLLSTKLILRRVVNEE